MEAKRAIDGLDRDDIHRTIYLLYQNLRQSAFTSFSVKHINGDSTETSSIVNLSKLFKAD